MLEGDHGGVVGNAAGHPERSGVGQVGHLMQPGAFLDEHLGRNPAGHPVHPGVDLLHKRATCRLDVSEAGVVGQQVRLGGHDVGLGQFDRVFHPALGGRIGGLTCQHRNAVVAAERDGLAVSDRHTGDVAGGHGLLVVGEHIGRSATQNPENPVQSGEHARRGAITQCDHDTETTPRQPRHEQHDLASIDDRSIAEIVLQPQPRLGDPRPVHPRMAQAPLGFHLSDSPPGGALTTGISQILQPLMCLVGPDLPA
jgi:hypothetical protein